MLAKRRLPLVLAAAGLVAGAAGTAMAGDASPPIVASPNVELVGTIPNATAVSGEFAHTGAFYYQSSTTGITSYDISDPELPIVKDFLPIANFENESVSYGERVVDGTLRKFVLVGLDAVGVSSGPPPAGSPTINVGACQTGFLGTSTCQVIVVDVTDPANIFELSRSPDAGEPGFVSTSTHTVQCMSLSCEYVYAAGDGGKFSVIDMRNLSAPVQSAEVESPSAKSGFAAGHYWVVDENMPSLASHTGGGGLSIFDITDQANPVLLNTTDANGTSTDENEYNNFILHNSFRPNADKFDPSTSTKATASILKGDVALITEEDYYNFGTEFLCSDAGSFATWYVPTLTTALQPDADTGTGTITPISEPFNAPLNGGGGTSVTGAGAFCSAHWFDYHQSGLVAQGYYQQGMRITDVRNAQTLTQFGYFTGGGTEVWDAYWVPERDSNGVQTGLKTNLIYTADFVRGMDILRVDIDAPVEPTPAIPEVPVAIALPLIAAAVLGGSVYLRRRRSGASAELAA